MTLKVSCFCCTYGRPDVLEQAIESFLRQDYEGPKELIVLNDFTEQTLHFDHPEVKIINAGQRITPLGKKFNVAVSHCSGDVILPWEDDDIYLPWRISYSLAHMQNGMFHTRQAWLDDNTSLLEYSENLYQCNLAVTREQWEQSKGYLEQDVSAIDVDLFRRMGAQHATVHLDVDDIFYVYRWAGSSSYHGSAIGGETEGISDAATDYVREKMNRGEVALGKVDLNPHWTKDWVKQTHMAKENPQLSTAMAKYRQGLHIHEDATKAFHPGFVIEHSLLVPTPSRDQLLLLDPVARGIWQGLHADMSTEALTTALTANLPVEKDTIARDIKNMLTQWRSMGLLLSDRPLSWYEIDGRHFAIDVTQDSIRQLLTSSLQHLACDKRNTWDHIIEVREQQQAYAVYLDGSLINDLLYADMAAQLIIECITAPDHHRHLPVARLQAAAACRDDHALLILGEAGSGKSTLLAALIAAGLDYMADNQLELLDSAGTIRPLATPIKLDSLATRLLSDNYPDLEQLPVFYNNNRAVRYLSPNITRVSGEVTAARTSLLFIDHKSKAQSNLHNIDKVEAMQLLLRCGTDLIPPLHNSRLSDLTHWLDSTDCYRFEYDDLADASKHVLQLFDMDQQSRPDLAAIHSPETNFDYLSTIDDYVTPSMLPISLSKPTSHNVHAYLPTADERQQNLAKNAHISIEPEQALKDWVTMQLNTGNGRAQTFRALLEQGYSMELSSNVMNGFMPKLKMDALKNANLRQPGDTPISLFFSYANIDITRDSRAKRIPDHRVQLYQLPHLISEARCDELLHLLKDYFEDSSVIDEDTRGNDGYRTSSTAFMANVDTEVDLQMKQCIASAMGIDSRYSESLQVQRYFPGQQYKVHADYFQPDSPTYRKCVEGQGQRTWTCIIYLNDDFDGGETHFERINKSIKPEKGMAAIWSNLTPLGALNDMTYHQGTPVVSGVKYILTAWFREKPFD